MESVEPLNPSQALLRGDLIPTPRPWPTNPTSRGQSVRHITVLVSGPRFLYENQWIVYKGCKFQAEARLPQLYKCLS